MKRFLCIFVFVFKLVIRMNIYIKLARDGKTSLFCLKWNVELI